MASLEKRPQGGYRIVFRYGGQKFSRSLKTKSKRAADAVLSRLEDNLYRAELGTFQVPDDADVASVLLSDGKLERKKTTPKIRTVQVLLDSFLSSIPRESVEPGTYKMMEIHARHLVRILGSSLRIQTLSFDDLQHYIGKRSKENGRHGKTVGAVTIKKEITTLSSAWKWAMKTKLVTHSLPNDDLRYPKKSDKPPFQTYGQIRQKIQRGGLSKTEEAELWESLFLTVSEVTEVLAHAKAHALHRFIHPMLATAAHTGARRSELLRSECDDFDFHTGMMIVREKKRVKGTFSMRTVPISAFLADVLKPWFDKHPGGRYTFCFDAQIKNKALAQVTPREAHYHFRKTLDNSKWKIMSGWHVFRHSFCSNCAAAGTDQRLINAWVGHQTEEMVRRYRHLIPDQQQKAIAEVFPSA